MLHSPTAFQADEIFRMLVYGPIIVILASIINGQQPRVPWRGWMGWEGRKAGPRSLTPLDTKGCSPSSQARGLKLGGDQPAVPHLAPS